MPITTKVVSSKGCSWPGVLDTTLCDKVCQLFATGLWFSPGIPVSSTNNTDCHNITKILLKVALNTIKTKPNQTVVNCPFMDGCNCEIVLVFRAQNLMA